MHCGPPPGVIKPVASLFQRINGAARNSGSRPALLKVFADAEWHYHVDQPRLVRWPLRLCWEYRGWERF